MENQPPLHSTRFDREPGRVSRPDANTSDGDRQCVDMCPICRTADVMRATLPPEFHEHWQAFQREAMLALRAALDHYIEHLDAERSDEPPIEDISII